MSSLTIEKGLPGIFGTDTAIRLYGQVEQGQRIDFDFFPSLTGTFTASLWAETNSSSTATVTLKLRNISPSNFSGAFSRYKHTESLSNQWGFIGLFCTAAGYLDITFELPQLEEGSYPTSYIPTQGSQVTRAADVSSSPQVTRAADLCRRVLTGNEFEQNQGTLYAEFSTKEFQAGIGLTDDTVLERVALRRSGESIGQALLSSNGVSNTINTDAGVYVDEGFNKLAVSWTLAGYKFACNGQIIGSNSLPSGRVPLFTSLIIATSENIGIRSKVRVNKSCRLFPKALSDAELIALTGSD
jgi:hypothetical protein